MSTKLEVTERDLREKGAIFQGSQSEQAARYEAMLKDKIKAIDDLTSQLWSRETEVNTTADRLRRAEDKLKGSSI